MNIVIDSGVENVQKKKMSDKKGMQVWMSLYI